MYSDGMEPSELQRIVEQLRKQRSDDGRVEVKASAQKLGSSVWESVSAFANTKGGTIILGLSEADGFTPVDGFDAKSIANAVASGLSPAGPRGEAKISPVPQYRLDFGVVDEREVVVLDIDRLIPGRGVAGPCYVTAKGPENGSFKRVADQDKRLSRYEIFSIASNWTVPEFDEEAVDGLTIDELDDVLVSRMIDRARQQGSRAFDGAESTAERLRRLNVVTKDAAITLAGAVCLAVYPQQYLPQLVIDVTVHPRNEKSLSDDIRFVDRQVCDGPLPRAVYDAVKRVMLNIRQVHIVDGSARREVPEIPEEVLREAITNAVMHRDYSPSVRGQQVAVDVYPDRVVVTNPGGLWGEKTIENIADGRSSSRNPRLANLLRWVPFEGNGVVAENQGSGVLRMQSAMRNQGLPEPQFKVSLTHVEVTLLRHGLLQAETGKWLKSLPGSEQRQQTENLVLALARQQGGISVPELRRKLGLDSDDAREVLGTLLADGLVTGAGDGPYLVEDRDDSDIVTPRTAVKPHEPISHTHVEGLVLEALSTTEPRTINDLAQATGKSTNSLRRVLRKLVQEGAVSATAPATSRRRAYVLPHL